MLVRTVMGFTRFIAKVSISLPYAIIAYFGYVVLALGESTHSKTSPANTQSSRPETKTPHEDHTETCLAVVRIS